MTVFEPLWQRPPLRIDFAGGGGDDLVIAFSSVGHDPTRGPSPEFVGTATARGARRALFVMDDSRSWANAADFGPALVASLAQVRAQRPVGRIVAMGLSMGAYAALVAAQIIRVDVVLAFGPQYSPLPERVAGETRWQDWTARLDARTWPTAPLPRDRGCWAILCHGARDDMAQARGFQPQAGTDHLIWPDHGHSDLIPHLKARGVLDGLVQAALAADRRRLLRIAGSAGGMLRARYDRLSGGAAQG